MCKYIKSYKSDHLNQEIHSLKKPGSHSEEHSVSGQKTIYDQRMDDSIPWSLQFGLILQELL